VCLRPCVNKIMRKLRRLVDADKRVTLQHLHASCCFALFAFNSLSKEAKSWEKTFK